MAVINLISTIVEIVWVIQTRSRFSLHHADLQQQKLFGSYRPRWLPGSANESTIVEIVWVIQTHRHKKYCGGQIYNSRNCLGHIDGASRSRLSMLSTIVEIVWVIQTVNTNSHKFLNLQQQKLFGSYRHSSMTRSSASYLQQQKLFGSYRQLVLNGTPVSHLQQQKLFGSYRHYEIFYD